MKTRLLLVNPPIYDFSAYDFWLKPYGLLRVAGFLRGQVEFQLFDFLDRNDARVPPGRYRSDDWGRGEFFPSARRNRELSSTYRATFAVSACRAGLFANI